MNKLDSFLRQPLVCPWWFIHTFDNPIRRLFHHPEDLLREFVKPGNSCLDVGCGYGYFTIPMAMLAGPNGSVTAVDVQPEMLAGTRRRAEKAGAIRTIHFYLSGSEGPLPSNAFDFALMFWMVHEVPDQQLFFRQICDALKPGGKVLLSEPKGHVRQHDYEQSLLIAVSAGLKKIKDLSISFSRSALLIKEP